MKYKTIVENKTKNNKEIRHIIMNKKRKENKDNDMDILLLIFPFNTFT